MFSFNKLNTIQSSKYTSRNLWIKSLKVVTTIQEKIAGELFKPKGMTIYINNPHSGTKVG
jgi:hypothetical protein